MMTRLRRDSAWLILMAVTAATGAVVGTWSNRWGAPPDLQAAAKRLARIPGEVGQWQLVDETPLDDDIREMLQCVAAANRSYRHRSSGETVHLSLIVGPPGPTSVHAPEICYSSQGYHVSVPARRRGYHRSSSAGDLASELAPDDEFWKTTFAPDRREASRLTVFYSWCDGQRWLAPARPRFAFGGLPYLYKLQLAAKVSTHEADPCDDFLSEFLPALAQADFYADAAGASGKGTRDEADRINLPQ